MSNVSITYPPEAVVEFKANDSAVEAERARLERAVLDAVKVWANNDKGFTRIALRHAAFELWKFEQEHGL